MGRLGRRKGAEFERLISKQIIHAVGRGFGKKDCYRTPMSGGHPFAGASDLICSQQLMDLFPFCVECKHWKSWKPTDVFRSVKQTLDWGRQVLEAARRDKFKRAPLLVMRGNGTDIYAAAPVWAFKNWSPKMSVAIVPALCFMLEGKLWKMMTFAAVLRRLTMKASYSRSHSGS
jgi:hypothetical protein